MRDRTRLARAGGSKPGSEGWFQQSTADLAPFKQSHIKCSAERRLLFGKLLPGLSFKRKSINHLFSRKQTPVLQGLCRQV